MAKYNCIVYMSLPIHVLTDFSRLGSFLAAMTVSKQNPVPCDLTIYLGLNFFYKMRRWNPVICTIFGNGFFVFKLLSQLQLLNELTIKMC